MPVLDQRGQVLLDIYNRDGNEEYKFFYAEPQYSELRWLHCMYILQTICSFFLCAFL